MGNCSNLKDYCEVNCYLNNKIDIDDNNNNDDSFFLTPSTENKITILYKINNPNDNIRLFGEKFIEKNKKNCKMVIDFVEMDLLEFYKPKKQKDILTVCVELKRNISDLSYMFCGCSSLISIPDFFNLNINKVTNISHMFSECTSLEVLPDISNWKLNNITDISYLFSDCSNLKTIPDISNWKTYNVQNMSHIFHNC